MSCGKVTHSCSSCGGVSYKFSAGLPGLSAYQIWLNQGNTGTEQDFLDSLKAEPRVKGIFKSHADAEVGGVEVGEYYETAIGNEFGLPDGLIIKRTV